MAINIDGEFRIAFLKDQAPRTSSSASRRCRSSTRPSYGAGYVTGNVIGHLEELEEPRGRLGVASST